MSTHVNTRVKGHKFLGTHKTYSVTELGTESVVRMVRDNIGSETACCACRAYEKSLSVVVDIFLTTSAALTLAVPLLVVLYQAFAAAGYPDRSYAILSIAIPILVVALIVLCIIKQIYDWNASWANRPESENKLVCILQNKSDQYGARTKESQMDEAVSNQVSLAQALDIFISL